MTRELMIRQTYVNPLLGRRTIELSLEAEKVVREWLADRGADIAETARKHRVNSRGLTTFVTGVGYDCIDDDLLGGDGTGRTHDRFRNETGCCFILSRR